MTQTETILLIGGILLAVLLAVIIPINIHVQKKGKKNAPSGEEHTEYDEPDTLTRHVTVLDMACGVSTVGYQSYKQPKAVKTFLIKFADDEQNIYDIPVSEGMYDAFEVEQKGTLTIINGQIDSFVLDEE